MSPKSKLGRNPFERAPLKPALNSRRRHSVQRRNEDCSFLGKLKWAVRFVSFDAPIGICFLTYQACLRSLTFRFRARN